MHTTEDKMVELIPCEMFDAFLPGLSLADAKVQTGSSRTWNFLEVLTPTFWVICWIERYARNQPAVG